MDVLSGVGSVAGTVLLHLLVWLLCLAGILASSVSFSGMWLVIAAALLSMLTLGAPGVGWIVGMVAAAGLIEGVEWVSSMWGIRRRGGSAAAGWAALGGGLLGLFLGSWIPVPVVGSLLGLLAGSFLCAYWVEVKRMEKKEAAHIARGAVLARLSILVLKLAATLVSVLLLLWALYVPGGPS